MNVRKKKQYEELFFSFLSGKPTVSDFTFYLQILKKNFHDSYIHKIRDFFEEYYISYFDFYKEILINHQDVFNELNDMYLKLSPNEILSKIQQIHEWIQDKISHKLIKLSIEKFLTVQTIKLPVELLLYLFLFYQIQLHYETAKGKIEIIWKLLQLKMNQELFLNLPATLELNPIAQERIETIISRIVSQRNQQDDFKYIMVINILKYISYPINEELIKDQFQELCQKLETSNINLLTFTPTFQILLEFIDSLNLQNKFIYLNIFDFIIQKISGPNGNELNQNSLLIWVTNKICYYNIHLSCLYETSSVNVARIFQVFENAKNNQFEKFNLPKFFAELFNKEKQEGNLITFYNHFKYAIDNISLSHNSSFELKLIVFYCKLLCKIVKKKKLIDKLKNIKFNSNHQTRFDINFIISYMNSKLRQLMRDNQNTNNMIEIIENKGNINFDQVPIQNYESISINDQFNINAFQHLQINLNENESLQNQLNNQETLTNPHVLCLELLNSSTLKINDFWSGNNNIIYLNGLQEKECCYVLKGAFYIDNRNIKNLVLYEYTTQCWFPFSEWKWKRNYTLGNLNSLTLIYFRTRHKLENKIDMNSKNMQIIPETEDGEIYWKIFFDICEINPKIIQDNLNTFYPWLCLNDISKMDKIYKFFKKKYLHENIATQRLCYEIIEKRNKINKKEKFHPKIIEIEKSYYYLPATILIQKVQTSLTSNIVPDYDFNHNQLLWNLRYYLDQIEHIKNIPNILVFYITFLYFLNKLRTKEAHSFWHNKLEQIKMIPRYLPGTTVFLADAYQKANYINGFENISQYWKNKTIMVLEDYKWKFLCELLIFSCDLFVKNEIQLDDEQKLSVFSKLKSFLLSNKVLLSVKNIEDNNIKLSLNLLYDIVKDRFYKNDQNTYSQIIKLMFEFIQDENETYENYQLTDSQKIILNDYFFYCFGNSSFLLGNELDLILKQFNFMSKFVNSFLSQFYFAKVLLILKNRNDSLDKKIKPLLLYFFEYYNDKQYNDLKSAIVYYLFYLKIERKKKKLNQMNCIMKTKNNIDICLLFLFMNKKVLKLLEESQKDNIILSMYNDCLEGKQFDPSDKLIINKKAINDSSQSLKNDLELIESIVGQKIFYIDDSEISGESSIFPNDLINEEPLPYIIYKYHSKPFTYSDNLEFSDKNYKLIGIILKSSEDKHILIKNHTNQYWYSFYDKKWMNKLQTSLGNIDEMISVFFLNEKSDCKLCNFNNLTPESEVQIFDYYHFDDLKWLMDNGMNDLLSNTKLFYTMFMLNKDENRQKFLQFNVDWQEPNNEKLKNIITTNNLEN